MNGQPERLRLISWRPLRRNSLRGFATVELLGLKIIDCPVHESGQKCWASLPAKPQIDKEGRVLRDAASGKTAYVAILEWRDRKLRDAFSRRVVDAVRAQHPDAFDNTE